VSYSAQAWARAQQVGNSTAKYVLRELAYCHNGETGLCCPSLQSLCDVLEIKKADTVRNAIRYLEEHGFISVLKKSVRVRDYWHNEYRFIGFDPNEWTATTKKKGRESTPKNGVHDPQKSESRPPKIGVHEEQKSELRPPKIGVHDPRKSELRPPKIGVHDPRKSGCNKEYKGKEQGIEGNKYTREQQPAKDESVADAPDYLPFDDELLDEIPFPEDEVFDDLAPIPTETKVESKPKQKRVAKPKKPTDELQKPEGVADTVWADWLKHKKRKSGKATQYVVNALKREADKVPMTLEQAMVYQLEQGWTGFKAEWVNNKQNSRPAWKRPSPFDDISHVDSWDEDLNS
jgi:hypothetical protein